MSLSDSEKSRRSSYGRGVFEGLRMAGIDNPGDFMNTNKIARLESGLNSIAKKVLEAVPIQEPWSKDQISMELRRTGCNASRDVIDSCLGAIADRGLAKEPRPGMFIRVTAKPSLNQEPQMPPATPAPIAPPPKKSEPAIAASDTLSRLASLGSLLRRASEECDAIALDVEERVTAAGQDGEKLRQLQSLLKSIGV